MSTSQQSTEPACVALSANQVAKLLGISVRHLWALHSSGKLGPRPISLGRSKRWRLDELHAWIAANAPPREHWDAIYKRENQDNGGATRG